MGIFKQVERRRAARAGGQAASPSLFLLLAGLAVLVGGVAVLLRVVGTRLAGGAGDFGVVLITTPSQENARELSSLLLGSGHAACVNIVPGIESHFLWQGKVETAAEWMLVVKTRRSLVGPLREAVERVHTYTVPEVIFLPLEGGPGENKYMAWLEKSLPAAGA